MAYRRIVLRWIHLAAGCLLGTFIYSPILKQMPEFVLITKILVVPILAMTGIVLWKQLNVGKMLGLK